MGSALPYNKKDPQSIKKYAQKLIEKSLHQVLGDEIVQTYKGKGKLGQILEDIYFRYKPNSAAEPDFPEANVELKTSPMKKTDKGLVSKERLVFNIINYKEEYKETFKTSSFWRKNKLLLLMFYLYEQEKIDLDYIFKIIRLWEFPANDLKIIKDDWTKIIEKIKEGKAHEISEGDTFYLGACTKGANKESQRDQPFSQRKAMQRAFSLKSKYLNFIIQSSLANEKIHIDRKAYQRILDEEDGNSLIREPRSEYDALDVKELDPIVKDLDEYKRGQTFEELVIEKFKPFYGLLEKEITKRLNIKKTDAKDKFYLISKAILGVKKKKIEEFEKADVVMKTIRLEKSGVLKESMSFAQIQFKEIVNEQWEESYWFNTLTKRFFFVVFQKDEKNELRLKKVMFWTMPTDDLEIAHEFWRDTKQKIMDNDYKHFIKISDDRICHVRPKGIDSHDLMETPTGRMEKKKCYWLNASYIKAIIE
jgi:DNA mismatch repair protein MutH